MDFENKTTFCPHPIVVCVFVVIGRLGLSVIGTISTIYVGQIQHFFKEGV
jgi:hypothetical protein